MSVRAKSRTIKFLSHKNILTALDETCDKIKKQLDKLLFKYYFAGVWSFLLISIEIADRSNFIFPAEVSIIQEPSLSLSSITLPCIPLLVITLSPLFRSAANFFSCLARFICGAIIKKYTTTNMSIKGANCPNPSI